MQNERDATNVVFVGLYSPHYPAAGETHALSVLAGVVEQANIPHVLGIRVCDMVAEASESIETIIAVLSSSHPTILAISVTYGTFSFLKSQYPRLREAISSDSLVVFGGPLASYLPNLILHEIDPKSLVVVGEGETAFLTILRRWFDHSDYLSIPGVVRLEDGVVQRYPRQLTDLSTQPVPSRLHVPALLKKNVQIFTEASRGCSWAACSFCLRGLTDVEGTPKEYRSFSQERILKDLTKLKGLGVAHVTFADEDFFGRSLEHAETITQLLTEFSNTNPPGIAYDISMMPHTIWSRRMSTLEATIRRGLLSNLKVSGLRKVFLGVESGSPTQLRRFRKGHNTDEAARAVQVLRQLGISLEIGWIMFDPLCSQMELMENVKFLEENSLARHTSYLFSEMRIQLGSQYHKLICDKEQEGRQQILTGNIDPDTLSFPYRYCDQSVGLIVNAIKLWTRRLRSIHYPLKNLSRFGTTGPLGETADHVNRLLFDFREDLLLCFKCLLTNVRAKGSTEDANPEFDRAIVRLAQSAQEAIANAKGVSLDDPRIISVKQEIRHAIEGRDRL